MDRKKIILIVIAALAVIGIGVAAVLGAIRQNETPDPEQTSSVGNGGVIDPNTGEIIEPPTPTPTPTQTPDAEHNKEGGDALGADNVIFSEIQPAYAAAAEGFLQQYLTWDSDETAEDRAARLAPFVAADSPLLSKTPGISLVDENPIYDYKSKTKPIWFDSRYTGWFAPENAQGNALYMTVIGNYEISQTSVGGGMNSFWQASGRWQIQFADWEGSSNPVIVDIKEPRYLPAD